MSMSVGLGSGSRLASAAAAKTKVIQAIAAQNSGPRRRVRLTGMTAASSPMLSSSVAMTDPGIEAGVEYVDDKIHQHEAGGDQQHHALQDDQVAGVDCADQQPADPRKRKNGFDDQRAADQAADVDAGDRHKAHRCPLQAPPEHPPTPPPPLATH